VTYPGSGRARFCEPGSRQKGRTSPVSGRSRGREAGCQGVHVCGGIGPFLGPERRVRGFSGHPKHTARHCYRPHMEELQGPHRSAAVHARAMGTCMAGATFYCPYTGRMEPVSRFRRSGDRPGFLPETLEITLGKPVGKVACTDEPSAREDPNPVEIHVLMPDGVTPAVSGRDMAEHLMSFYPRVSGAGPCPATRRAWSFPVSCRSRGFP
jgi:hypothetical protein